MSLYPTTQRGIYGPSVRGGVYSMPASAAAPLLLDGIGETPLFALSTRALKTSYAGNAIRVSGGSTDLRPGFTKAQADALGTGMTVPRIYDLSGATSEIWAPSVTAAVLSFDVNNKPYFDFGAVAANNKGYINTNAFSTTNVVCCAVTDFNPHSLDAYLFSWSGGIITWNTATALRQFNGSVVDWPQPVGRKQYTIVYQAGNEAVYIDSVLQTAISGADAGATARNSTVSIGNDQTFANGWTGKIYELIFFASLSAGSRATIEASQQAYFSA